MIMKTEMLQSVVTKFCRSLSLDSLGLSWTPAAPPTDLQPTPLAFGAGSNGLWRSGDQRVEGRS